MRFIRSRSGPLALALSLLAALPVLGQGLPTGNVSGRVINEGQGLPGVTVTARSANLQGSRSAVTSANGAYVFPNLPPGEYAVAFEISGFESQTKTIRLGASQSVQVDVTLALKGVATATEVVATAAEAISQEATSSSTYTAALIEKLPTQRTFASYVNLAPGVAATGPNGAFVISGAASFDNLFTVNGVVVQDNIRGTPLDLYIEDAIQEATISTGAISAEYGRFQGGVVNALTKSGGNEYHGSFRVNLANDSWAGTTPVNETLQDKINPRYEATVGGPIWKDRIWFFGAGRLETTKATKTTTVTNISYAEVDDEKRYEGKLTLTPFQNHSLTANYTKIDQETENFRFGSILDTASLFTPKFPQELFALNYNGTLSASFFLEASYSRRKFAFENYGAQSRDLIAGTLLRDQSRGNARYHAPTFCGVCDPEDRDNRDILLKGTYFLSTPKLGSHTIVAGYDRFSGQVRSNNYQSGSDYRVFGTSAIIRGTDIFPVFDDSTYFGYTPIGLLSQGSDLRTDSAFLNDSWRLTDTLSFNLGARWDQNHSVDSRGVVSANDTNISPRFAATWDTTGTGKMRVTASYAKYVAAIQENLANAGSDAGQPAGFYWYYTGPEVNTDPTKPLQTQDQALRTFFDYIFSKGCPNIAACQLPVAYFGVPGVNTQIRGGLTSPNTNEYQLSLAGALGPRFSYRADFVRREYRDFYSQRTDRTTGTVFDSLGNEYDLTLIENSSRFSRDYTGMQLQFSWRPLDRLSVGGNWTWSHLIGNVDGETPNSGPVPASLLSYPEYVQERWNSPRGSLAADQRHKVRAYATYDVPLPKLLGSVSVSAYHQMDSGSPYGAVGTVPVSSYVTNPGYLQAPLSSAYYFTARDEFHTPTINRTDLALNWGKSFGPLEVFLQPQVANVFNNQGIIAFNRTDGLFGVNTTVETSATRRNDYSSFNPFTSNPTRGARGTGANWNYGPTFGQARNSGSYQLPRTFRVSFGLRF